MAQHAATFQPVMTDAFDSGEQNSLALERLVRELPRDRKLFVLDFGPASPGTVDFFAGKSCRIFFEDFYRAWQEREEGKPLDEGMLRRLLPFDPEVRFDVIFLWDTLNYLDPKNLGALLRYLEAFSNSGAAMTAFLWLSPEIPALPTVYRITERGTVRFDVTSTDRRSSPRYSPHFFKKVLKKFELERMYLLRSGQREAVFVVP